MKLSKFYKQLKNEQNPARFLFAKILMKTRLCKLLSIKRRGYKIRFHPSAMSQTLWINSDTRLEDEDVLIRFLKPGDTFVDIGANVGTLTLKAASIVSNKGKVISFEAHPRTFSFLEDNLLMNRFEDVTLHNCAMGNKKGNLHFTDQTSDDQNCVSDQSSDKTITVNICTLDEFEISFIDLLKIDVEGFEKFVLEGGSKTLENTKVIFFECWQKHCQRYNYKPSEIFHFLHNLGFEIFLIEGESVMKINDDYKCDRCVNLIATRNSELIESVLRSA